MQRGAGPAAARQTRGPRVTTKRDSNDSQGRPGAPVFGSRWGRRVLVLAFVSVSALTVLYLVITVLPDNLASTHGLTPNEAREEVGRVRTALLAILAGAIALTGAVLTALTYSLNRRIAAQSHERDLRAQLTDRFTRAIDQIGSDKLEIRLGGIYALEQVARDSEVDRAQVIDVLVAFVKERTLRLPDTLRTVPVPPGADEASEHWPTVDVQAALTVLGRRSPPIESLDFQSVRLRGAVLRGAQLAGAYFSRADLKGADFTGADLSNADLWQANLTSARFDEADLSGAQLALADLSRAHFARANLRGAKFQGVTIDNTDFTAAVVDAETRVPGPQWTWKAMGAVLVD
jgi:Pentapeptide repeats (8 copies)